MPGVYRSSIHCFNSIVKYEGISGLFKGVWSPTFAQFIMGSLCFAGNEITKSILEPGLQRGEACSVRNGYLSGCMGGLAQSIVLVPTDLIKCKMQMNHIGATTAAVDGRSLPSYNSSWDCVIQTVRSDGIRGLFRGFGVTCIREIPSYGVYFLSYSSLVDALTPKATEPTTATILMAGGAAGSLSWLCIYPVDVIKTNLQIYASNVTTTSTTTIGTATEKIPTTMMSMGKYLMRKHGLTVFAQGLGISNVITCL